MEYIPHIISLEAWIEEFRNSIIYYNPLREDVTFLNQKYGNIAYEIYEFIFAPLSPHLEGKSLTIVPGGILGYLPFEALLTNIPEIAENYQTHPYLINDYQISYNYSAFLLKEKFVQESESNTHNFLGIAPRFDSPLHATPAGSRTYELGTLRYNIPEVERIRNLMGGDIFIDSAATESNFRRTAPNYQIIHGAVISQLDVYEIHKDILRM